MGRFLAILLLTVSSIAAGDVYKWVAPDGSVYYEDQPRNGAQRLELPMWVPPTPPPASPLSSPPIAPIAPKLDYDEITVKRPRQGEFVREEGGGIAVFVAVRPSLRRDLGHVIRIVLDGVPQGSDSRDLTRRLVDVDRGEHTVAALVVDPKGRVLIESQPVSFFYQRTTVFPPKFQPFQPFPRAPNVPPRPSPKP